MRAGLAIMRELGTADEDVRAVGGGARSDLWLRLQADAYGRPIRRTAIDEGPAYGAALLGGVAAGVFRDVAEAETRVRLRDAVVEPDPERAKRYDELFAIHAGLYPATREAMHALTRLAGG
jgi:xylulokinase